MGFREYVRSMCGWCMLGFSVVRDVLLCVDWLECWCSNVDRIDNVGVYLGFFLRTIGSGVGVADGGVEVAWV